MRAFELENATVRFLPEPGTEHRLAVQLNPVAHSFFSGELVTPKRENTRYGTCLVVENVTGEVMFSW